ncbi:hypothetical protein K4K48_004780 [Colletotrichum sp. SAR 10_66]|nr:hypothetical protein K4K48_004780 [Colletotrichum sp. SAR 10_66]
MSHGTSHRSSSQSYGNSKDASRSDPRRRSHSISHQVSRTISHDPTCDICNDATSCDKCRQGSIGTSHSSSSDVSRTFSHTMPQSTSYTTYSGGDSRIGSGDFSKSFSQSLLYGGSSHKDHEGSSNNASNAMAESYSRDFPQSTSYATRGGDSHHDSTDFSPGRRQSFLQSFHRSSYDGHGDVPKALNFAPKSSSHMVSESFSPDLPQSPSWEIRTDFNPHGSGNNDTSHEACCDICSGGSSSSSNEASNHVTHVSRDGGGGGGGGFYEDWSNHSHRPQSPTHDRAHNISGIIVGDRSKKVTGDAHKHKTRDVDGPTSNTSGNVSTTTHTTSNNGTPNVSGNTSTHGHPKRHGGPHGASRDVTNNNSREQTDEGTSSHYVPEKDPFNGPTYSETSHDHGESDEHRRVGKPITRHGWRRFLHGWMIHIPAIILTAIILWLASRERYWYGLTGPSRVRLSPKGVEVFLLFAFKIYEIFVILSLSAMAISMFRRRLIGGGVRLGFLTGAYRVGDFRYIFSLPFWRHGFLSLSFWEMMLALFVLFATIFSLLLLPAAGALLLPSLQWYGMNHNKAFGGVSAPLLYQTQPDQVWPTLFTDGAPWNNTPVCVEAEGIYNAACPAGGFTTVWNWAKGYSTTGLQDTVTFSSPSTNLSRQLMITEVTGDPDTRDPPVLSTTPSHHFNINFGLVKNYIENGNTITEDDSQYRLSTRRVNAQNPDSSSPIYQPFIQSLCNVVPKSDVIANNGSLVYPMSSLNCFGDATCLQMKRASPARSLDVSAWDSEECHLQLITTDFFVFQNGTPIIEVAGQLPDVNGDYRKDRLFSCTMLATWVAAEVSTDSSECGGLVSDLNDPETMIETYQKASFSGNSEGYVMKFDPSWFQYLSPVSFASSVAFNGSDALRYYNPPESLVRNFVDAEVAQNITNTRITNSTIDSARAEVFLAKVFGVYLTDAIARTGSSSTALIRSESGQSANQLPVVNSNVQSNVHFNIKGGTPANETTGPTVVKHISSRAAQDDLLSESMGFDFGVERYGWGTGKPSRALEFGKAILYMYFAVLILYLLTVMAGLILELCGLYPNMRVLSIVPWWDLQGLLVLAMRTPRPGDGDFADAGAGITSSHLWKKRVRAMADLEHNVQLVYNDDTVRDELDKTGKVKYF